MRSALFFTAADALWPAASSVCCLDFPALIKPLFLSLVLSWYLSHQQEKVMKTSLPLLQQQNAWKKQPGEGALWLTVSETPVCGPCFYWVSVCYEKGHHGNRSLWGKLFISMQAGTWGRDWGSGAIIIKGLSPLSSWKPLVRTKHSTHEPVRDSSHSNHKSTEES